MKLLQDHAPLYIKVGRGQAKIVCQLSIRAGHGQVKLLQEMMNAYKQ